MINLHFLFVKFVQMIIIMIQQLMTVFYAIINAVNAQVTPKISLYVWHRAEEIVLISHLVIVRPVFTSQQSLINSASHAIQTAISVKDHSLMNVLNVGLTYFFIMEIALMIVPQDFSKILLIRNVPIMDVIAPVWFVLTRITFAMNASDINFF